MKLRESGMPHENYWESLFDVLLILDRLGIDHHLVNVVELGCGYGTFTVPVAQRIRGTLTACDCDPVMIERTRNRLFSAGLNNAVCSMRDVVTQGFPCASGSQDACLLFNILHGEAPVDLLMEAARVVRPSGHVLVIHWRYDPATPRGPSIEIRPKPEQILAWADALPGRSLAPEGAIMDLPPWHYGLKLKRLP